MGLMGSSACPTSVVCEQPCAWGGAPSSFIKVVNPIPHGVALIKCCTGSCNLAEAGAGSAVYSACWLCQVASADLSELKWPQGHKSGLLEQV